MDNIKLIITHDANLNKDSDFFIKIYINDECKTLRELATEQILHIGAILLSASRKFINITSSKQ